ncbi:glycoside hydrolase [Gautieria morchelliformis]|nr:glycoside hydrolase [Gautieria morchelliformis]
MLSLRLSLFVVFSLSAAVLFLVYYSDAPYTYGRMPGRPRPPRPPYPPFHPPKLDDITPPHLDTDSDLASQLLWSSRATSIKEAFVRAYHSYETYAPFPADELQPISNRSARTFNGWGVTMVDSLDTMLLLGLEDEFQRAVSHVATLNFTMRAGNHAPFFETVIRYLGGFLAAYALSGEPVLLARAEELATKLLPAFNTSSGLPVYGVNTMTKEQSSGTAMLFAEIASCQMEYKYLAHLTGREEFYTKVDRVMDHLAKSQSTEHGMWPTIFDVTSGTPASAQYTVGAYSDSAYEYLLKQYLLSGKTEHRLAEMYMKSMTGILDNLVFLSRTRNLLYVTDSFGNIFPSRKFEHLSCFFPGLLALGAGTLPDSIMSKQQRELHMWAAEGLAHTCWVMYADRPSGLGPEIVVFDSWARTGTEAPPPSQDWKRELWMEHVHAWEQGGRQGGKPPGVGNAGMPLGFDEDAGPLDYSISMPSYLLRPETLESMFILYRTTKDTKWRERGWEIWEAIESQTRTESAYASVYGVDALRPTHYDSMPSYFLAETVKYAYLIAVDEDPWPSDSYVFNTEAHPLPVFSAHHY